jgi:galactose mutarotase-like enzyme
MPDDLTLTNDALEVRIAPRGAELRSVRDVEDREWLWQGDPDSWARQAPVLFPVVAHLRKGVVRHRGSTYPMPTHGFAPVTDFAVVSQAAQSCILRCSADERTRAAYPFDFRLDIAFELSGTTLLQSARVTNLSDEVLPSSVGFHPGFQWPLPTSAQAAREAHVIGFEADEPHPIRRLASDGLGPAIHPSPVQGRVIALADDLFAAGAMVFDRVASRRLWFGVPGAKGLLVDLGEMPHLGIWTRPPARYLCIEPWQGFSDPEGFEGELLDKPGIVRLPPAESYTRSIRLSFGQERPDWTRWRA